MGKTLLLCYIHGFKGDEETFFQFPEDLKNLVSEKCTDLNVQTRIYPKYETRGDLAVSATTFREWLQDQVTDLERDAATPQAIMNPSVNVILVAHSMGGFVAVDTLFSVLDNRPVSADPKVKLMFPLIQGVLAFDTPYNGLSRSMFAYGAFSQYQNISSVWSLLSTVSASLAGAGGAASSTQLVASQASSWRKWQALAARTGTYGAILAGGVAAYTHREQIGKSLSKINKENLSKINRENLAYGLTYVNRENISQGLTYVSRDSIGEGFAWAASHLKFVGTLMKPAQLTARMERLSNLKGIGVVDLYTSLGDNGYFTGGFFVPKRTFCAIPAETEARGMFKEQQNTKAKTEIEAHCSMFQPEKNSGYESMITAAQDLIVEWTKLDPRTVVDDYTPDKEEAAGMESEAELFDDDGKVLSEPPAEDEQQLQAILKWQNISQYGDGGIDESTLKQALEVPLPVEDESTLKHASEVPLPKDDETGKEVS